MITTLNKLPELKIISVRVKGILERGFCRDLMTRMIAESLASGYPRILIDVLETTVPPAQFMSDALFMLGFMRTLNIPSQTRFAFVYRSQEELRLDFERLARIENFHVKHFKKREEAIRWLCK